MSRAYLQPLVGVIMILSLFAIHRYLDLRQRIDLGVSARKTWIWTRMSKVRAALGHPVSGAGDCQIFILDPLVHLGLQPRCNLSNSTYWPYSAQPELRTQGIKMLQPWENQLAVDYWIARAIELSSYQTKDMNEANLVYVNLYCHNSWFYGTEYRGPRPIAQGLKNDIGQILRALSSHQRWLRTSGRDFALPIFHPAWDRTLFDSALKMSMSSPLIITSESRMFQPLQDKLGTQSRLVVPYVAVNDISPAAKNRDIFLYFEGRCAKKVDNQFQPVWYNSSGKKLRWHFVETYANQSLPDVRVSCSDIGGNSPHEELMSNLARSIFCAVIAGDAQSSRRLSEVVLQGCIPVFLGPPFHTLPLASDIDYAGMGIFLSIKEQPWRPRDGPDNPYAHSLVKLGRWTMDRDSSELHVIELPTIRDIYPHLKALLPSIVRSKQACVVREQPKFLWPAPSGRQSSVLGSLVVERLCDYGRMLGALAVDSLSSPIW